MALEPRAHIMDIPPCVHGALPPRERTGDGPSTVQVLDFSASCNPMGASPRVLEAIRNVDPSHYPDDDVLDLRRAIARGLDLDASWVAVGNGSVDLIYQLASAYLRPGESALVAGPTFGEFGRACRVAGAPVIEVLAEEERSFEPDVDALKGIIRSEHPKLAYVCNPNNPTGRLLPATVIADLLEECHDTLLIVDEAYLPFADAPVDLREYLPSGRLLLLRSLTKDHGLAGLRLGCAVAPPEVLEPLGRIRQPWGVNAVAQAAGLAALEEAGHVEAARRVIVESREYLIQELAALGLRVIPPSANFLLVRVGDGAAFRTAMLARGVCVRDCGSFGLPAFIRIGVRTLPECQRLMAAAREVVRGA